MERITPRIACATEQDRPTVLTLLSEHLEGHDVSHRYAWLYQGNPHGRAVTFVAYDPESGAPMGLTSLFPRKVRVHGKVRLGSIGGDGYVRPAFRRRGVATALHRACLAYMGESLRGERGEGESPVEFMYGAPEPHNLTALEQAGSRAITRLRRYGRPRLLQRALRAAGRIIGKGGFCSRAELVPIGADDRAIAQVWEASAESAAILPIRDASYYAFRFGVSPSSAQRAYAVVEGGRPIALCALERRGDTVAILDFLAPRARYAAALRAASAVIGGEAQTLSINDGSPIAAELPFAGFVPREAKLFQVLAPAAHAAANDLYDPSRWHYMWADGDVDRILV